MAVGARFRGFSWRPLGRRKPVIAGFDLTIEAGERILITGPSGAGKSTLLYALAGALGTTIAGEKAGDVEVDGRIGLLLQNPGDAVVAERIGRDVAFGPENLGLSRADIARRVGAALAAVRLPYSDDHFTTALSGGELQRLALAGVLAMMPQLLLLDEPTSMLDEVNATAVRQAIVDAAAGSTLIVVEHHIGPWLEHVDRVIVLSKQGCIVSDGPPTALTATNLPDGVWAPGLPRPTPLVIPEALVRPQAEPLRIGLNAVTVDLRTRTLRGAKTTHALTAFSGDLEPGAITALRGPSGAGKSTALATFAGLLTPRSGSITPNVNAWRSPKLAAAIGWVPQNPEHGFLARTVAEEVAKTSARLGTVVDTGALLDVFGLSALAQSSPYRLSGGEQRRLALAAALGHRPGVVLLDEPTVGQDRNTWAAVVGWLSSAADAGAATGVATHDELIESEVEIQLVSGRTI